MSGRYAKNLGTDWRTRSQAVSLTAEGLNTRAESYCADVESDGLVPDAFLAALCGGKVDRKAVAELVAAGWWERAEGGHLVTAYTARNGTRAQHAEKRRKNAERQDRFRNGSDNDQGHASSHAPRNALRSASPSPSHQSQSPRDRAAHDLGARAEPRPTPAGIVEAALITALGAVNAKYAGSRGDVPHLEDAASAMALSGLGRPLRDIAAEWVPDFVAEFRVRTPKNLAEYAKARAANGGAKVSSKPAPLAKRDAFQPPAPASAFEATEITPELFRREAP